jgi:uncharacterized membrane protein
MNKELRKSAFNLIIAKWKNLIGIFLLYGIITIALNELFDMIIKQYITKNEGVIYAIELLLAFITIPLYYGLLKYCMDLKNNKQKFKTLFEFYLGSKLFFKTIGSYLLQLLYIMLKTLLFIIPGIIAIYEYALVEYLIIKKPEIKINDAIKQSKEMMKNHKRELFSLQLSFVGWYILIFLIFISMVMVIAVILSLNGVGKELLTEIITYTMFIMLMIEVELLSAYTILTTIELFDKIYNKSMGIDCIEENTENNTHVEKVGKKKRRMSIITIAIILVIIIVTLLYFIGANEISNTKKFDDEMDKLVECIRTDSDVDMEIYSADDLGKLEEYLKNLYGTVIQRDNAYYDANEDIGIDNLLVPSMLDVDRPNMSKSKEKVAALRSEYENLYSDIEQILDIDRIKSEIANIKMDETVKAEYIDGIINNAEDYSKYMISDKDLISDVYDSYSNLISFLATKNTKWHAIGDQMYLDDSIIKEYNVLYNKVIEAEDVYYD